MLKNALLACHRALKSALLARCLALKVPFSWELYHALFLGLGGNTNCVHIGPKKLAKEKAELVNNILCEMFSNHFYDQMRNKILRPD